MITGVYIDLSRHGGVMARFTDDEGRTAMAQRLPTLADAMSWVAWQAGMDWPARHQMPMVKQ